jgi:D-sedoheptulose 7-phosphate isomerase
MNKQTLLRETEKCFNYFEELEKIVKEHQNIIILGNGGSSAIASHISQDYTKKLKKRSFTFSDSSRLTCYTNDYGYENAYLQFLKEFTTLEPTLVVLISSSGNSINMLKCAEWAETQKNIKIVTLTGFNENNKLKTLELSNRAINFWVNSDNYGIVECVHMSFLHMVA